AIRPSDARAQLNSGYLFLNTSLTEAFGINIIAAASAGLFVVSTHVGGVLELLPAEFIKLAEPDEDGECIARYKRICMRLQRFSTPSG
ncbi:Phosphatidylinositol N-acetylglucosaminyltransferase GPI3 subunit, partial [Tilletia horrida]